MASITWNGGDQQHIVSPSEDDFAQFLDMGGMHFDFRGFQGGAHAHVSAQTRPHVDSVMSTVSLATNEGFVPHQPTPGVTAVPSMMASAAPDDSISSLDAQIQYLQQQKMQQQQNMQQQQRQLREQGALFFSVNTPSSVPPTPQSFEMAPANAHFLPQSDQVPRQHLYEANYEANYRRRISDQQDMVFTPLVSPAVTPLDPHYSMDNAFTVPAAYFSPLTSPAIHAQTDFSSGYDHSSHSNNSPVEMELEPGTLSPTGLNQDVSKKARKSSVARVRGGKANIKSSPITKRHRRKTGPSPSIASQVLSELDERKSADQPLLPMPASAIDASDENASVSPENPNEMPPPPLPHRQSTSKSPHDSPQNDKEQRIQPCYLSGACEQQSLQKPHPATPASLMKLSASQANMATTTDMDTGVENIVSLEFPESVSNSDLPSIPAQDSPIMPPQDHHQPNTGKACVGMSKQLSAIKVSGIVHRNPSPQLRPNSSGQNTKKTPQMASRNSRTRPSSSIHASPALLPRISPNIKPLIPGTPGLSAEDTASRLLATKSNYQNILEGNTVPGVSYPSELSTNLTSKRTSHKIAEQGRRNRINTALQTMASLLPDPPKLEVGDDVEKREAKAQGNVPNSKASVVESAIDYLRHLQDENIHLRDENKSLRTLLDKLQDASQTTPSST